ncbi:MAG: DUF4046 domain-containing protein [Candidatus Heimdallarchaeota archaeon]|nr:DUF4046 domain-containing protein [Candidatus Heimdallarchaeota archaeon]
MEESLLQSNTPLENQINNLSNQEAADLIRKKIEGKITKFPQYFWSCENGRERAILAIKILVEEYLKIDKQEVIFKIRRRHFKDAGLESLFRSHFSNSLSVAIQVVYPNNYPADEISKYSRIRRSAELIPKEQAHKMIIDLIHNRINRLPLFFWTCSKGRERLAFAIRYFFEEYKRWTIEDIPKKAQLRIFNEVGLQTPIDKLFNCKYFDAIDYAYPGVFQEKQFKYLSKKHQGERLFLLYRQKLES